MLQVEGIKLAKREWHGFNPPMTSEGERAASDWAENLASRLAEFGRFAGPDPEPDLMNRFLAAQVRSLIEERLAPRRLRSGIFSLAGAASATGGPLLVDGAVQDPERGGPVLERGGFCVINPATCVGFIEVRPSASNIPKFQARLREISVRYALGGHAGTVMGVVASDEAAERKSIVHKAGRTFPCHQFKHPRWCPIFILFSRRQGRFEPHLAALEALVENLNRLG